MRRIPYEIGDIERITPGEIERGNPIISWALMLPELNFAVSWEDETGLLGSVGSMSMSPIMCYAWLYLSDRRREMYPLSLFKDVKYAVEQEKQVMITHADDRFPESGRFLERLGFIRAGRRVG